jgi:hypothetical protein
MQVWKEGVAPTMPLTNTAIRNAKPGNKPTTFFDERGLYLEVSPTGGKWWRLKFRFGGKEKRLSLGVYPDVPLKDARDRRDIPRKLLADGIDPSENRKAQKLAHADSAANSFEVVARVAFEVFGDLGHEPRRPHYSALRTRHLSLDRQASNC